MTPLWRLRLHRLPPKTRLRLAWAALALCLCAALWALPRSGPSWPSLLAVALLAAAAAALLTAATANRRAAQLVQAQRAAEARLAAVLHLGQEFIEADDEAAVIDTLLRLCLELVGAEGVTYTPLDEYGQPQALLRRGQTPPELLALLAAPTLRDRCAVCALPSSGAAAPPACPLHASLLAPAAASLTCLPLQRGAHRFGLLNLFTPADRPLAPDAAPLLRALLDETGLALEGLRLRQRELTALRQVQALRQKSDLASALDAWLESIQRGLEADFVLLHLRDAQPATLSRGEPPASARAFIANLLTSLPPGSDPLLLGEVDTGALLPDGDAPFSLAAAPLPQAAGALIVGANRRKAFSPRQLALLSAVAAQIALAAAAVRRAAELEYQTLIGERTRLAREIHDGLAQTLGFLKLHTAQMQLHLERRDLTRLRADLDLAHTVLADAYLDARQAIDGLRLEPAEIGLAAWLTQAAAEFRELSGLPLALTLEPVAAVLPPEVQAQLLRIVQEALTNIRKHAQARQAALTCRLEAGTLWLEIRDDGVGFLPEDVPQPSRHGLRGMQERAELIGADFQVISRAGEGACIRVRLPLPAASLPPTPDSVEARP